MPVATTSTPERVAGNGADHDLGLVGAHDAIGGAGHQAQPDAEVAEPVLFEAGSVVDVGVFDPDQDYKGYGDEPGLALDSAAA